MQTVRRLKSPESTGKTAPELVRIAQELEAAAPAQEAGHSDIGVSIATLRRAGWLADDGSDDPAMTAMRLRRVGAANLSVGRLWEGHINALYLAHVHGAAAVSAQVDRDVADGAILGVWGADGATPVTRDASSGVLRGEKVFASGLGTVTQAVVTVNSGHRVRLALVDVRDPVRADPSAWAMQGMRATASGRYDLEGIAADGITWIGGPGDYLTEPHFIGGVWRIAALQIGGTIGLLDCAASDLRDRGRLDAPAQMARLSAVAIRAVGASALVTRAAAAASHGATDPETAAALSAAARLLTEEVGLDAIRAVEQCLGLAHFADGSDTGRKARDLAVYMRQAARDAFQERVGRACFGAEGALWAML